MECQRFCSSKGTVSDTNSYAAHHIVAGGSQNQDAIDARNILEEVGIGINSKENGVFLPRGEEGIGANHNTLHTKSYYAKVNTLLQKAYSLDGDKKAKCY